MIREVTGGVIDSMRGALYLARHRALWKWVIAPAVVVAVIGAVTVGWLVALLGTLGLVRWSSLAIAAAGVIVTIASIIAGPFCEMLSEAIEEHETGVAPPRFSLARFLYELAIGAIHAVRRAIGYVVLVVGLVAIDRLVPTAGPALAAAGGAWVTARYASYDAYDAIWARRQWRYRDKLAYLRAKRWRTIGLGAVVAVVMVVPGVNIIGIAIGATGATLRVLTDAASAAPARETATAPT